MEWAILLVVAIVAIVFLTSGGRAGKQKLKKIQPDIDARRARDQDYNKKYQAALREYDLSQIPRRKHAKPEIDKFLNVKRTTRVIIFDVETNGLSDCSVLSCSAIKYAFDPENRSFAEIGRFDRCYYPIESFNQRAVSVNGLSKNVIAEKRHECVYPDHFCNDPDFESFCSDTNRFVAHNISFDLKFTPFISRKKKFCTMMTNMDIVCAGYLKRKKEWKYPKLSETAAYYGIKFEEKTLHGSMADTEITSKIFMKMIDAARA